MSFLGLAALLIIVGAAADSPALVVIGLILALVEVLRNLWRQRGLTGVTYERRIGAATAVWVINPALPDGMDSQILPLAWLTVEDHISEGASVRERPIASSDLPGLGVLRNGWTLGPYERVVREQHIVADRRGRFRFGPVRLEAADLFRGRVDQRATGIARFVPRLASESPRASHAGALPGTGRELPAPGLVEDPALFAGVRPYQPGDPLRRIHWKAAARTGVIRSKRFDPSREREVVIALDMQTLSGPHWLMAYDDDALESVCVAAASIARDSIHSGAACGLAAAAFWRPTVGSSEPRRSRCIAAGPHHRVLARMSPFASGPFELALAALPRWLGRPVTIVSISARDPSSFVRVLRGLGRGGHLVRHVALGADAPAAAARLLSAGIPASTGRLAPDWQTADALDLAG